MRRLTGIDSHVWSTNKTGVLIPGGKLLEGFFSYLAQPLQNLLLRVSPIVKGM
jgi:hypothetical protein